jgi:hypothetical protein
MERYRGTPFPGIAEVQQQVASKAEAPDPSDVHGTMRFWDEYRARERARLAKIGSITTLSGRLALARDLISKIDDFPSSERLAEIATREERIAAADAFERAQYRRAKDTRWKRLKKSVGTLRRSVTSGARSALRALGIRRRTGS